MEDNDINFTNQTKEKPTKRWCCCIRRNQKVSGIDIHLTKSESNKHCLLCCSNSEKPGNCGLCFKKFVAFLFSHIGLCSFIIGYSILGGLIFMKLEAPYELSARNKMTQLRKDYVNELWNLTYELYIFHPVNWSNEAEQILKKFQKKIYKATKQKGWDGKDGEADSQWSFAGALLYSITVITTIGYGHIAPKTNYGRLVTMVYATIGIPLTLLCLANLGNFLGQCFRILYRYLTECCLCMCCPKSVGKSKRTYRKQEAHVLEEGKPLKKLSSRYKEAECEEHDSTENEAAKVKPERIRVPIFVSLLVMALYIFLGAIIFSKWENWPYLIGSYFCFITLTTIGFGDYVPGADTDSLANQQKQIICAFYLIFGLSLLAMSFNLMQEEVRAKFRWLGRKFGIIDLHR